MARAKPPKKRAKVPEIAGWLDVSKSTVYNYIERLGLKADSAGKYAVLSCFKEHKKCLENDPANLDYGDKDPPIKSWADVEKREKVKKLRLEIQSLTDDLVPKDEVRAILAEHAAAVRGAMTNFIERVAARKRDPKLLQWAKDATNAAIRSIGSKIPDEK